MRLILLGSGAFGLPTFKALAQQHDHEIVAVISQPDRPAGRKRVMTPTPVSQWALENNWTLHRRENVNESDFIEQTIKPLQADAAVVIAFGQKLGEPIVAAMGQWVGNLHASLLPRYRGAAPINRAMMAGDPDTGVCVIEIAPRMDAGDIFASASTAIAPRETAGELHDRLADLGPQVIQQVLRDVANNTLTRTVQDESLVTVARKMSKLDSPIDFNQPATAVRHHIHGVTPWPGAKTIWQTADGKPQPLTVLRVIDHPEQAHDTEPGTLLENHRIACAPGGGTIELLEIQAPGSKPMPIDAFTRGRPMQPGDRFVTSS